MSCPAARKGIALRRMVSGDPARKDQDPEFLAELAAHRPEFKVVVLSAGFCLVRVLETAGRRVH